MVEASEDTVIPLDDEKGGEDNIDNPEIYMQNEKQSDIFMDELAFEFSVRNPQDFNGHIVYEVKGRDEQGEFEAKRRYNEFYSLHEKLTARWPGCLIPRIPAKKAVGNKDLVFI